MMKVWHKPLKNQFKWTQVNKFTIKNERILNNMNNMSFIIFKMDKHLDKDFQVFQKQELTTTRSKWASQMQTTAPFKAKSTRSEAKINLKVQPIYNNKTWMICP